MLFYILLDELVIVMYIRCMVILFYILDKYVFEDFSLDLCLFLLYLKE